MLDKIKRNLDATLALIGIVALLVISVVVISLGFNLVYVVAFGLGFVCIVVYLLARNKIATNINPNIILQWIVSIMVAIIFLLLALLFYNNRSEQYMKPLLYYICSAIAVIFIFISAFDVRSKKQIITTISVIAFLALLNVWTECMLFPNVIGMDAWVHQRIVTEELPAALGIQNNTYSLPPLNAMTIGGYYSLFHLYIFKMMDIGLDYKMTVLIFWTSWQVIINVIFAYLIGNNLFNKKVGIVAALMIAIAGWVMFFNEWAIPNAIGITFCLVVAYLMIKLWQTNNYWLILPVVLISLISFLIHIIVSIWVIGVVACISIIPQIFSKRHILKRIGSAMILPVSLILLFILWLNITFLGVALTTSVAVAGEYNPDSGLTYAIGKAPDTVCGNGNVTDVKSRPVLFNNQLSDGSLFEISMNSIGMFLYIGLAIIGTLSMLKGKLKPINITWVALCYAVLLIGLLPPLVGKSLIEHRWWCLAQTFMAIPLAVILIKLAWNKWTSVIIGTLVGIIAFMSAIGLPSNISNRALSPNLIVRYGFTEKELEGFIVAENYGTKRLGSDSLYLAYVQSHVRWCNSRGSNSVTLDSNILGGSFKDCAADVIVLRDSLYKEPFAYGSGAIYKLYYNPVEIAKQQGYKEVFDNGEVHCLIKQ